MRFGTMTTTRVGGHAMRWFALSALLIWAAGAQAVPPIFATPDQADLIRAARSLQDGFEDDDGVVTNSIGGTGSAGSGDTDPNAFDTDGDGIGDGVESGYVFPMGAVPHNVFIDRAGRIAAVRTGAISPASARELLQQLR